MGDCYDIAGIGFGPSNLALAVALRELGKERAFKPRCMFIEQNETFSWFPEMLLDEASMQTCFLKDLVTLRNPKSSYSFLSYLKMNGRLESFINLHELFPTRREFHDYFKWAADQFRAHIWYAHKVIRIDPIGRGTIHELRVVSENTLTGQTKTFEAKNIVVALGKRPRIPYCVKMSSNGFRIGHTSRFLSKIAAFDKSTRLHFAILGGGQSSAEICHYLYQNFPYSTITVLMRGMGFRASNTTEFIRDALTSSNTDSFFNAPHALRHEICERLENISQNAVSADLIKSLYKLYYKDHVSGTNRLKIKKLICLKEAREYDENVIINFTDLADGSSHTLKTDALIVGTGFENRSPSALLERLMPYLHLTPSGDINIGRNYRVTGTPSFCAGLFIQGTNEETHGPGDAYLSQLSSKSGEIAEALFCQGEQKNFPLSLVCAASS